ncbi:DUF7555 family protein [Natronosalvus halobius]|uniref:DUF7555 family protein n=1 Tax=Natronosalvus halobius TaxID=2953746 RepID=UPI0020A18E44|nr:hypothetical protein [Natronosalvus halobius]USZ72770.1 hypothetical protein NGM15_05535 [Natronosalvus halobius]
MVIDTLTYVLVVAAVATVVALAIGIGTGGGFVRGKFVLFLLGFVLMAYSVVRLWPSSPTTTADESTEHSDLQMAVERRTHRTPFQAFVRAVPPLRWVRLPPPDARLSSPLKLFVSSLCVLAVSYLMETWFGVA